MQLSSDKKRNISRSCQSLPGRRASASLLFYSLCLRGPCLCLRVRACSGCLLFLFSSYECLLQPLRANGFCVSFVSFAASVSVSAPAPMLSFCCCFSWLPPRLWVVCFACLRSMFVCLENCVSCCFCRGVIRFPFPLLWSGTVSPSALFYLCLFCLVPMCLFLSFAFRSC